MFCPALAAAFVLVISMLGLAVWAQAVIAGWSAADYGLKTEDTSFNAGRTARALSKHASGRQQAPRLTLDDTRTPILNLVMERFGSPLSKALHTVVLAAWSVSPAFHDDLCTVIATKMLHCLAEVHALGVVHRVRGDARACVVHRMTVM